MKEKYCCFTSRRVREVLDSLFLVLVDVPNLESLFFDKIEEAVVFRSIDGAEDMLLSLLCLDVELEASELGAFSRKVDVVDFVEADVHRWLVQVHEAAFKREEDSALGFVRASHARKRGGRLEVAGHGDLATSYSLHQAGDELEVRTLHLLLQLAVEFLLDFGFINIKVDGLVLFLKTILKLLKIRTIFTLSKTQIMKGYRV